MKLTKARDYFGDCWRYTLLIDGRAAQEMNISANLVAQMGPGKQFTSAQLDEKIYEILLTGAKIEAKWLYEKYKPDKANVISHLIGKLNMSQDAAEYFFDQIEAVDDST